MDDIKNWISESEAEEVYSSKFWNDVEQEKQKAWWILDGKSDACLEHLRSTKLLDEFFKAEEVLLGTQKKMVVADLAAGIGWSSALLSKLDGVEHVHAVEISRHRLGPLFEECVKLFAGNEEKISRYLGSFYDLKFESESIDVIFAVQAFHHADRPLDLLAECSRVVKSDGLIILLGEPPVTYKKIVRRFLSSLIKNRQLIFSYRKLFPPDEKTGDHYYRYSDYQSMFQRCGFQLRYVLVDSGTNIWVASKR